MIAVGTATVWRRKAEDIDHAGWEREVLSGGCKLEVADGMHASSPQAQVDDSASFYSFRDCAIAPGDMLCAGACHEDEPPEYALHVVKAARKTLRGAFHHLEVQCR